MKFIALLEQAGEGCDYTIGCGKTWIELQSQDRDNALLELEDYIKDNCVGECALASATLLECSGSFSVNVNDLYNKIKQEKLKEKLSLQERQELDLLAKLKKKYDSV